MELVELLSPEVVRLAVEDDPRRQLDDRAVFVVCVSVGIRAVRCADALNYSSLASVKVILTLSTSVFAGIVVHKNPIL